MKTLFWAFTLIFLLFSPAYALEKDNLPVVCDQSVKIYEALKRKNFQPIAIGEVEHTTTVILVNPDRDMVVAVSVAVNSQQITCIFVGGEKNTEVFDLQKQSNSDKKL